MRRATASTVSWAFPFEATNPRLSCRHGLPSRSVIFPRLTDHVNASNRIPGVRLSVRQRGVEGPISHTSEHRLRATRPTEIAELLGDRLTGGRVLLAVLEIPPDRWDDGKGLGVRSVANMCWSTVPTYIGRSRNIGSS